MSPVWHRAPKTLEFPKATKTSKLGDFRKHLRRRAGWQGNQAPDETEGRFGPTPTQAEAGGGVLGWVMGDAGLTPICPLPPHSPTSSHPNMPCLLFPICSEGSFGVWIPKRPGSLCRPGPGFGFLGSGHWPRCAPPMDGQSKTSWLWATPGVSDLVPDLSAVPVFPRTSHFLRLFIYAVHLYQEK